MLSIDEAIAHAREVAEEQRKDNGNCEYKAEYGCKGCADYYSKPCIECAEEHEHLAEWLEELKALKNGLNIKCDSLNEALEKGKKIEAAGFIAINPCTLINGGGKLTWEDYIDMDLAILKKCNCIYMLNGWQNSRGACIEKEYADRHGIPEVRFK